MKRSKGFTLVELLVVVGIIALLVTILMPTLGRAMELARRSICGANLNAVGKGIHIYLADLEKFPLVHESAANAADLLGVLEDKDALEDLSEHVMQNVWLLIKYGTSEKTFQCPSHVGYKERFESKGEAPLKYGWVSTSNFSYGIHKCYGTDPNDVDDKARLTSTLDGSFVLLADRTAGGPIEWDDTTEKTVNKPLNHKADGFNCLTYQGSVKYHNAKVDDTEANSKAGIEGDCVYTAGALDDEDNWTDDEATDPDSDKDTFILKWASSQGTGT